MRLKGSILKGSVERISYHNRDSGQCILEIKDHSSGDNYFISGRVPWIYPGVIVHGQFVSNIPEGNIWRTENLTLSMPETERTLKKFLKSEAWVGIGPKLIKVLSKNLPTTFFSILENSPNDLLGVPGIGQKKKNQILHSWNLFKNRIQFLRFLFDEHLPLNWVQEIWPRYEVESLSQFKLAPYDLGTELHLQFDIVDGYGLRNGFALDSFERIRFGFNHILWSFYKQGHCAYPEEKTVNEAMILLETSREQIEEILEIEILNENIVVENIRGVPSLYFKPIWLLEKKVAQALIDFTKKEPPWGWFNSQKVLGWAQEILNIQLAPKQKEAIETALSSSLTVITGGPGTGKTTLIKSLVTILQTQYLKFALCSPTGRAAQRLGETTQRPAQTIHRLLKYEGTTGKFAHNKNNPLSLDLVLVDEASMVDLSLMADLLEALPVTCALILVGDADQIPSVGSGNVLHSVISSKLFRVVRLTEVYRQSAQSLIKDNARRINLGNLPVTKENSDFQFIPVKGVDETKAIVIHLLEHVIPEKCGIENIEEIQILVPLNQGVVGAQAFNHEIQKRIYRNRETQTITDFGHDFRLGDKVMAVKNDYKKDIFNGDIGFVEKIFYDEQFLEVNFSGRPIRFDFYELDQLTLAYAISIHKSQGSEYRVVIVVLTEEHLPMAQRHLIYTAVTRGKEFVFLVAEPSALRKVLQEVEFRWENLTYLLQATMRVKNDSTTRRDRNVYT